MKNSQIISLCSLAQAIGRDTVNMMKEVFKLKETKSDSV